MHFFTMCHSKVSLLFPKQPHCCLSASGSILQPEQLSPLPCLRNPQPRLYFPAGLTAASNSDKNSKNSAPLTPGAGQDIPTQFPVSYLPIKIQGSGSLRPVLPPEPFPAAILGLVPHTWTPQRLPAAEMAAVPHNALTGCSHSPPCRENKVKCLRCYGEDEMRERWASCDQNPGFIPQRAQASPVSHNSSSPPALGCSLAWQGPWCPSWNPRAQHQPRELPGKPKQSEFTEPM